MTVSSPATMKREPCQPGRSDWIECYDMPCWWCSKHCKCDVVEAMMEDGGAWPEGGSVSDPGAGVACLSYEPVSKAAS